SKLWWSNKTGHHSTDVAAKGFSQLDDIHWSADGFTATSACLLKQQRQSSLCCLQNTVDCICGAAVKPWCAMAILLNAPCKQVSMMSIDVTVKVSKVCVIRSGNGVKFNSRMLPPR